MACYYPFGHCIVSPSQIYGLLLPLWPLYCLSSDLWLVITPLAIALSVLRFMICYYPFGHCIVCPSQIDGLLLPLWSLYCLSFSDLWLVITPLVIVLFSVLRFMACYYPFSHCIVCPSQIYGLLLPLWPLYYLSFSDLWVITPLAIVLSVLLRLMA